LHLVVEDAERFAPENPTGEQAYSHQALGRIARRGRVRNVGVTLVSDRLTALDQRLLGQADVLFGMRTVLPSHLACIDAWLSQQGVEYTRSMLLRSLPSLGPGDAWLMSPSWLQRTQRIRLRPRRTFDASALAHDGRSPAPSLAPVDLLAIRRWLGQKST
jgi:DNA helicase HerA-like ATPase